MKSNLFFIIGIRRSGTSILRELIMKHPRVAGCEFEPHDLWAAIDLKHFPRLIKENPAFEFVHNTISNFECEGINARKHKKWYGAKFALNPGVKALEWVWLKKTFPDAKFIFIIRHPDSTWNSYVKQDKNSVRGLIMKESYYAECRNIRNNYMKHFDTDTLVTYGKLTKNTNEAMIEVFESLELPMPNINFKQFIKKSEF